jgi:hypothetical protein
MAGEVSAFFYVLKTEKGCFGCLSDDRREAEDGRLREVIADLQNSLHPDKGRFLTQKGADFR